MALFSKSRFVFYALEAKPFFRSQGNIATHLFIQPLDVLFHSLLGSS